MNRLRKNLVFQLREAAKKSFFSGGQSTKRREGVRGCTQRKKERFNVFFYFICSRPFDPIAVGWLMALVDCTQKKKNFFLRRPLDSAK